MFSGFVSGTGKQPRNMTTIDYYFIINKPITEYKVVKELLKQCEAASKAVGQIYTWLAYSLGFSQIIGMAFSTTPGSNVVRPTASEAAPHHFRSSFTALYSVIS